MKILHNIYFYFKCRPWYFSVSYTTDRLLAATVARDRSMAAEYRDCKKTYSRYLLIALKIFNWCLTSLLNWFKEDYWWRLINCIFNKILYFVFSLFALMLQMSSWVLRLLLNTETPHLSMVIIRQILWRKKMFQWTINWECTAYSNMWRFIKKAMDGLW